MGRHTRDRKVSSTWEVRDAKKLRGKRVELIHCADRHTRLQPGTRGTVVHVDDRGTPHIKWDNGIKLGLVADCGDRFKVIDDEQ